MVTQSSTKVIPYCNDDKNPCKCLKQTKRHGKFGSIDEYICDANKTKKDMIPKNFVCTQLEKQITPEIRVKSGCEMRCVGDCQKQRSIENVQVQPTSPAVRLALWWKLISRPYCVVGSDISIIVKEFQGPSMRYFQWYLTISQSDWVISNTIVNFVKKIRRSFINRVSSFNS